MKVIKPQIQTEGHTPKQNKQKESLIQAYHTKIAGMKVLFAEEKTFFCTS